jgi:hypothetical protein
MRTAQSIPIPVVDGAAISQAAQPSFNHDVRINHNVRVEIERVNGNFVAQCEVSSCGRAKRTRKVSDTFVEAMEGVAVDYLAGLAEVISYSQASPPNLPSVEPVRTADGSEPDEGTSPIPTKPKTGKRRFAEA